MPHSDVPSLQCLDFLPKLSSRRQTAWRTRDYDGAAAARAIEDEAEEESEESEEEGSEAGADAAQQSQRNATVQQAGWRLVGIDKAVSASPAQQTVATRSVRGVLPCWRPGA